MKKYLSILLILVCTFMLTACGSETDPNAKVFQEEDFEITLNNGFEKSILGGIKYFYKNEEMQAAVVVKVESKQLFENAGIDFPDDTKSYAEFVVKSNNLVDSKVKTKGGSARFAYDKTVNGKEYHYYGVANKKGDAYYLVTFYCFSDKGNEYQNQFDKWADSIVIK